MKKFDYLVVGSGLYGAIFAHEAKAHVCDKAEQYAEHIKAAMKKFPKELPERAYQDVLEIYNTEAMKRKYIRLYTDIIEGKY